MSFPRYSEYKDSGVGWLGLLPAHWVVAAVAYRYEVLLGKMLDEKRIAGDHLAPYLRNADVQWDAINVKDLPQMDFAGDDILRYSLRIGDLLVCEGGEPGRAAIWKGELGQCFYQKALHRLRQRDRLLDEPRFMFYLLRMATHLGVFSSSEGKSTIAHLTAEALRRYRFGFPPKNEQRRIATFLDRETAKIDALVEVQKRLIELLKEKRQAVISQAVTKGLDPNVPMKDSGVEWLGKVPAHWRIVPLGRVTTERCDGPFGSGIKSSHYTDEGALVVRLQNIRSDGFNIGEPVYLDAEYFQSELAGHAVIEGDLLIAGLGDDNNLLGRACVAPPNLGLALVKADCFRFRLDGSMCPEFVAYQLCAGAAFDAGQLSTGTTRSRMPLSTMTSRKVACPPKSEQELIVEKLGEMLDTVEELSSEAERGIALLQERRSALISAAVTGKIDVRGLVPQPEAMPA